MISICEQKNLHKDLTVDRNLNPLADSPVSYSDTTKSPHLKYKLINPYDNNKIAAKDLNVLFQYRNPQKYNNLMTQ
jgi:hypothetical protein